MMMTTNSSRGIYFILETVQSPKNISQINILYYMIIFPLKLRIQETWNQCKSLKKMIHYGYK